ncbi:toxin-activating lysine-acyltransferase [Gemmobacter caeruleus]|uniref:toxin-activating lysine-acyltransferase n=1 Tax=Gemmobacter caeruleus TaxID=2595004 RepID=UPI001396BC43|nr:toxin-activating lysine-acyltransferase [Gemmobacter caeruleus]
MTDAPPPHAAPLTPGSEEFLRSLGQITWLMGLSDSHRDLPIHEIEARIQVPLMLRQVRIYTEGPRPIAALTWAGVSESIRQALQFPQFRMRMQDWRSGPDIIVVDCISPFAPREKFEALFQEQLHESGFTPAKAEDR